MRGAIALAGGGETKHVMGLRAKREITLTKEFVALGDYNAKAACVGCDRFDGRADLIATLKNVLNDRPERVVFEGMIYCHTYKLAHEISLYCKSIGYDFRCVFLNVDYETALERIFERNGAKPVSYDGLMRKILTFNVSEQKLIRSGVDSVVLDAAAMTKGEIAQAVYEAIVS